MYYLRSENKSADQLRGYRAADLRLCFRKRDFSQRGSDTATLKDLINHIKLPRHDSF